MEYVEFSGSDVMIMTCSDCNISCKHCYVGYEGNFNGDDLFELCKNLKKKYNVMLNGTEILLHPEFFKSIELVGEQVLLTNGLALNQNPSIAEALVGIGIKYVGISYHFDIHDEISSINLSTVKFAIQLLKQAGIMTDIRTTVDVHNFNKVKYMCEKAYSFGASGIKFTNLINTGRALDWNQNYTLSDVQIERFLCDVETLRKVYSKDDFAIRRCGSFGPGKSQKFFCPAGETRVIIAPNLKVYPCVFLARKGMEIGYVDNGRVMVQKFYKHNQCCIAKQILNDSSVI